MFVLFFFLVFVMLNCALRSRCWWMVLFAVQRYSSVGCCIPKCRRREGYLFVDGVRAGVVVAV
jgi:hypothetical protein